MEHVSQETCCVMFCQSNFSRKNLSSKLNHKFGTSSVSFMGLKQTESEWGSVCRQQVDKRRSCREVSVHAVNEAFVSVH